jgi:hypothetical protein
MIEMLIIFLSFVAAYVMTMIVRSIFARYIYLYANRVLMVNGLFVISNVFEIYLLLCIRKLFRKPVSEDDISNIDLMIMEKHNRIFTWLNE